MSTASTVQRIKRSLRECTLKPSLRLCLFEGEYCLDIFGFLIALPFMDRWHREPEGMMESWGMYYFENSLVLCWRNKTKFIHMPWDWDHCKDKHMVQVENGSWVLCRNSWDKGGQDNRFVQDFSYTYILKNGLAQNVMAKVHVERREWRRKCFWRIPLFAKKRQSIEVQFSEEVGERAGSWKGGCVGCGYNMRKGETAETTLRRMERERSFR